MPVTAQGVTVCSKSLLQVQHPVFPVAMGLGGGKYSTVQYLIQYFPAAYFCYALCNNEGLIIAPLACLAGMQGNRQNGCNVPEAFAFF